MVADWRLVFERFVLAAARSTLLLVIAFACVLSVGSTQFRRCGVKQVRTDLQNLSEAIEHWRLDHPDQLCPTTLETVFTEKYVARMPRDPWGEEFLYRCPAENADGFEVASKGPDRRGGTDDDVIARKREPASRPSPVLQSVRWLLGGTLAILAACIIAGNLYLFIRSGFGRRGPSLVPLVGGWIGGASLVLLPHSPALGSVAWIPWAIDPGCGLMLAFVSVGGMGRALLGVVARVRRGIR